MSHRTLPPVLAICAASLFAGLTQPPRAAAQQPDAPQPAPLCTDAIQAAERRHSLPPGLLTAIGQVESGRPDPATDRLEPWPWTVQSGGQSLYFASKSRAVQWVRTALAHGVASIDVGCLQINLLYHPRAFNTLEEAFEPLPNADYAARFLHQLYVSTGDWRQATGVYHSRTSRLAAPYEMQVERRLSSLPVPWPGPAKPVTTLVRLSSAWRATVRPVDLPSPLAGTDWSVLLRERSVTSARPHRDGNTK